MADYIALIHKDADSDYGVTFPDFPGCVTAASDLASLRTTAKEALDLHIQGMIADGETIPSSTELRDVDHNGPVLIVEGPHPQVMRLNVTLPKDLVRDIDRATPNRSRFLAEAAREKLRAL